MLEQDETSLATFRLSSNLALSDLPVLLTLGGSLLTALVIIRGLLSNTSLILLSKDGARAFTGDNIVALVPFFFGVDLAGVTDVLFLTGLNFDCSLSESANLSSSLSALLLIGLLRPGLFIVNG